MQQLEFKIDDAVDVGNKILSRPSLRALNPGIEAFLLLLLRIAPLSNFPTPLSPDFPSILKDQHKRPLQLAC